MSFYADIKGSLAELFADEPFLPATIARETKGAYDPATRRTSASTVTSIPCRAYPEDVSVRAGDGTFSVYTSIQMNVAPVIGDKITVGGVEYTVTGSVGNAQTGLYEATAAA